MSRLHHLAKAEAFHRVPETCPELHTGGTKVAFAFCKWIDARFHEKLTDAERTEIAHKNGEMIADLLEIAKDSGTRPLRDALVREIEQNMRLSLSQERIDRIEAGEDPEATFQRTAQQ